MQTFSISGQITLTNGTLRTQVSLADSNTTTSTQGLSNVQTISNSWTVIDPGSNTSFRFGYFNNLDATASVKIAIGNTSSYASLLLPGDFCFLTNSSSAVVYAQATGATSAQLQYIYVGI